MDRPLLLLFLFLIVFSISGGAVQNYESGFESDGTGSLPPEWEHYQDRASGGDYCSGSSCEVGHDKVVDDNSGSGSQSLECLERSNGKRHCYIEINMPNNPDNAELSFDYELAVNGQWTNAQICINDDTMFEDSNTGMCDTIKSLDQDWGSGTTVEGWNSVNNYDLNSYAGQTIYLDMWMDGRHAGNLGAWGRAAIDNVDINVRQNNPPNVGSPDPTNTVSGRNADLSVYISGENNENIDVEFYRGSSSSTTTLGEAGLEQNMDDSHWHSVNLDQSYDSRPLVFTTTQTTNGGQDPSSAHVKGVSSSGFDTQHCEWDESDTCDTHNPETNGWLAVDPGDISDVEGLDSGTVSTGSGSGGYSVSFDSSISNEPLVFTNVQTEDGNDDPLNTQARSISSTGATIDFCEQESQDDCEDHTSERVAWLALDSSQIESKQGLDFGTFTTGDSNWQSISFSETFSQTPAVIATVQTENGGQEALYAEADHVDAQGADIRFCEAEGDNSCDTHSDEEVAWLAVEPGAVQLGETAPEDSLGSDSVSEQGTARADWNNLQCGREYSWSVIADDGGKTSEAGPWDFSVNCQPPDPPTDVSPTNQEDLSLQPDISAQYPQGEESGELIFETQSGQEIDRCDSMSSGDECTVQYESANSYGQDYSFQVKAYEDATGKTSGTVYGSFTTNYRPQVENLDLNKASDDHSISVTSLVSDEDGESDLQSCRLELRDGEGNNVTETIENPEGGSTGKDAECDFGDFSQGRLGGWSHLEQLQAELTVEDNNGAIKQAQGSIAFPNHRPEMSDIRLEEYPGRDAISASTVVKPEDYGPDEIRSCSVTVESDGRTFASGELERLNSTHVRCFEDELSEESFSDLDLEKGVTVTVRATDIHGSSVSKTIEYNSAKGIDYRYSSIIMGSGSIEFLDYQVANKGSGKSTYLAEINNVNASFTENDESEIRFNLTGGDSKTLSIRIAPETNFTGSKELEILSRNQDSGVMTNSTIPIQVRDSKGSITTSEVPGISLIQLIVLTITSTTLFILRS